MIDKQKIVIIVWATIVIGVFCWGLTKANAQEIKLMHSWDLKYFDDLQLTYAIDSQNKQFQDIVDEAVTQWEIKLHPIINFAKTRNADKADILFDQISQKKLDKIVDKYEDIGTSQGMTEAFDENSDGYTDYVKVHILYKLPQQKKYATTLHEFGHALGLQHTDEYGYVMNPKGDALDISKCEIFGIYYTNDLGRFLDGELYYHDDYKDLEDECVGGYEFAAKEEKEEDDD